MNWGWKVWVGVFRLPRLGEERKKHRGSKTKLRKPAGSELSACDLSKNYKKRETLSYAVAVAAFAAASAV